MNSGAVILGGSGLAGEGGKLSAGGGAGAGWLRAAPQMARAVRDRSGQRIGR